MLGIYCQSGFDWLILDALYVRPPLYRQSRLQLLFLDAQYGCPSLSFAGSKRCPIGVGLRDTFGTLEMNGLRTVS